MYDKDSFDWVPTFGSEQVKEEDNGLFSPQIVSHIREFHSNVLHVSAVF